MKKYLYAFTILFFSCAFSLISYGTFFASEVMIGIKPPVQTEGNLSGWQDGLIDTQSFDVTLSEYGPVYFASCLTPGSTYPNFYIVNDGQILEMLSPYTLIPKSTEPLKSVDAVSFVDCNHDGHTDILTVISWDSKQAGVVYLGTAADSTPKFLLNRKLSNYINENLETVTISDMLSIIDHYNPPEGLLPNTIPDVFYIGSGAGAWGGWVELNTDGSFTALYHNGEMGDSGENYAASSYDNTCTGKFDEINKISETIYRMHLAEYKPDREAGDYYIENQIRYVAADVYGIYPGTYFSLYLYGTRIEDLPLSLQDGWFMSRFSEEEPRTLMCSILYNEDAQIVFNG